MEIDFITAFGRLLRDGKLRDTFAASPRAAAEQVQLRGSDLTSWLQLISAEVELQAIVLLRKRLDRVKYFAPETCRRPGEKLWPIFQKYARNNWPPENGAKFTDAFQFCQHLREQNLEIVAPAEWNRLAFALSKRRITLHWVEHPVKNQKTCTGFQLLLRGRGRRWREFFFYLGL